MPGLILANATILDASEPEPRPGQHIRIDGGRISDIEDAPLSPVDAEVVDVRGRTVLPGLIDAHVHLIATTMNLAQMGNEPASLTAHRSARIMRDMLARGFTTVRDAAGADWGLAKAQSVGLIAGPRVHYSGRALSQTGGHGDFRPRTSDAMDLCACCSSAAAFSVVADGIDAVRRAAREELRRGAHQIKIMASGGVASPSDPIWNLQYSDEEISAIVWEATSWRTYVMAHAYTPEAVSRAVRLGVRSIEHNNLIDTETAALMAERGAFLVPTLVTYRAIAEEGAGFGFPAASLEKNKQVIEQGLRSLEIARAAGVAIGFGTDLLGETQRHQSREFSIRAEVMSPFEIIESATATNARLLSREGEIGVVAPGALADLLVIDGDPLDDLGLLQGQGAHLRAILQGGRFVKNELD